MNWYKCANLNVDVVRTESGRLLTLSINGKHYTYAFKQPWADDYANEIMKARGKGYLLGKILNNIKNNSTLVNDKEDAVKVEDKPHRLTEQMLLEY